MQMLQVDGGRGQRPGSVRLQSEAITYMLAACATMQLSTALVNAAVHIQARLIDTQGSSLPPRLSCSAAVTLGNGCHAGTCGLLQVAGASRYQPGTFHQEQNVAAAGVVLDITTRHNTM